MIRWPWQKWRRLPPPDPNEAREAEQAMRIAECREVEVKRALRKRRAIIVEDHIATDIRRALEHRG